MRRLLLITLSLLVAISAHAQTKITVRAKAKDAKFIGSSIGGARIIVREKATGEILAEGTTSGSTGNTDLIMREAHQRYEPIAVEGTAKFEAILDIEDPVFVSIEAIAPVNKKQAAITVTTELWIIPGKDITGDGVVLEIPGFVVDVLSPQTHQVTSSGSDLKIKGNVVMMCGCPLTSGGLWNADEIEVTALVRKDGERINEIKLDITDQPNIFEGKLDDVSAGLYEITLYAFDPRTGNTGLDKVNFVVR